MQRAWGWDALGKSEANRAGVEGARESGQSGGGTHRMAALGFGGGGWEQFLSRPPGGSSGRRELTAVPSSSAVCHPSPLLMSFVSTIH